MVTDVVMMLLVLAESVNARVVITLLFYEIMLSNEKQRRHTINMYVKVFPLACYWCQFW